MRQREEYCLCDADLLSKATEYFNQGNYPQAAATYQDILTRNPENGDLYINLGVALRSAGALSEALNAYKKATEVAPKNAVAWFNYANALRENNDHQAALNAYESAHELQPRTPEFLNNLGVQLVDMGFYNKALARYDAALRLRPHFADAITNRGNLLQRMCLMPMAKKMFQQALKIAPNNALHQLNMSSFFAANGEYAAAIKWVDTAIKTDPGYIQAHLKKASLQIQQGDLTAGFNAYEDRWQIPHWHALPAKIDAPMWRGENITGKSLLVWNEQGFGDALMYVRFLPDLVLMGADVTFMCEKPLMRLMRHSLPGIKIVDLSSPPPPTDYHVSIVSLPARLGVTLAALPAKTAYLKADSDEVAAWATEIARRIGNKITVGLVWAGNPSQSHDYARSMPPDHLEPLLENKDIGFFNLLIGPRGDQWRDPRLIDVRDQLTDFAATAALMKTLDLVISVDSAPAHLAGGLGVALKILLSFDPDSRYFLARNDNPWYPSATLHRQKSPGNWAECVVTVQQTLAELTST